MQASYYFDMFAIRWLAVLSSRVPVVPVITRAHARVVR